MKYNLPERVVKDISVFALKHGVRRVTLFGSRAKGTNTERSDIDIAVSGGNFDAFHSDIKEKTYSLLSFDIVDLDSCVSDELIHEIEKNGVIIYEKT